MSKELGIEDAATGGRSPDLNIADCHPEIQPLLREGLVSTPATVLLWDLLGSVDDPGKFDRAAVSRLAALACFAREYLDPDVRERFEWLTFAESRYPATYYRAGAALLAALNPSPQES